MMQNPVIVVPGITATGLRDEYPVNSERVWTPLSKDHQRVSMHPSDLRYELQEPSRVVPDEVWSIPYNELIKELRHDLSPSPEQPTPVYPFPYDWRQPIAVIREQLALFIDEVIDRTALLEHAHEGSPCWCDDPKVDLVGHSMGGMVIASYIAQYKDGSGVGKVATLGTPFQGSLEALLKLATGEGSPGGERTASRDRGAARLTPAVYHLLPSFRGAISPADGLPKSVFDARNMQPSTLRTIESAIERHGPHRANAKAQAESALADMLKQAKACHKQINSPSLLSDAGMDPDQWLCIIGVGERTRVGATIDLEDGNARYDVGSMDKVNEWDASELKERYKTGDGTVPYRGAKPRFLEENSLVLVVESDFDWFLEIGDRLLSSRAGFHGMLPNLNLVQRLVTSHLIGRKFGRVWGLPDPAVHEDDWNPPIEGLSTKK